MFANPILNTTFTAEGTIEPYRIVKQGAANFGALAATAPSDRLVGVSTEIQATSGERVDLVVKGIAQVKLGGAVTRGQPITAGAAGVGVVADGPAEIIGHALISGASGDVIPVLLARGQQEGVGSGIAALLAAGLGASETYAADTDGAEELVGADAAARVALLIVTVTQTFADNTGTKSAFAIGEEDNDDSFVAAIDSGTAGDVLIFAGPLTATKALIVTGTPAVGDGAGAISVTALVLPAAA